MFYIYLIMNLANNKIYVGKTNNPTRRWQNHVLRGHYLYNAIRKYGKENFSFEILDHFENEDDAFKAEQQITLLCSNIKGIGYNLDIGGSGGKTLSQETKNKISLANTGKKHTDEAKLKIKETSTGRVLPEEAKQKISLWHIGKIVSHDTKLKIGKNSANRKLTDEQVNEIKSLHSEGILSNTKIAKLFDVSRRTIDKIVNGTSYKFVRRYDQEVRHS